ncbi:MULTISPECIES: TetR/AcrR family transcriptional regulator [unclassified Clostridioides]|uniref:TetR/AcrR family transcriptional regulator n=1 Tax=unclassified Clostridioides TaxID=2635829 RepID=UPI001D0BFBA3|nr:TetR/AcrR family transcriptional regulator [Clostridioides sp. ES-S-0001-02]MCC0652548.1 TetR/AcrR family transcriptional regulator [Clostridioides sp. ES-S-0001-03]MCC0672978.1 TetR/AcrR family transcriptional regulator [Clostridioides sp. ES-S-0145-01]MCC0679613.1 TetR/AcrR family transcriptional regulator [Clostridioides sp. ES-S-0005-03]MCC0695247.1 TetR/AcrR family transcriptional regulator [Clostridioides sp. ES-S-0048-02]MCC0702293.1 TetR/AcrR family transcriptional regulator [Clostr
MSRNKHSDKMRSQILDVAWKIFEENDYDDVTMQQIVDTLDISKESVYYHFKDKELLFEEIISSNLKVEMENLKLILNNPNFTIREKVSEFILHISSSEIRKKLIDYMCLQKKPILFMKSIRASTLEMTPLLSCLIKQGVEEGIFKTDYPNEMSEVFIILINIWLDPVLFNESTEKHFKRIECLANLLSASGVHIITDNDLKSIKAFYRECSKGE